MYKGESMNFTSPIEMPRATHYGNNYYRTYSPKLNRVITCYSNLEYYNYLTLETNPLVKTFCEQPLKIEIIQDDKVKYAIFDMWVKYHDGSEEFQEVKYSSELNGNDPSSVRSQEQIRRQENWCKDNAVKFVVRTEKDIIKGPFYLRNLNVISSRIRRYVPNENIYYQPRIIKALRHNGNLTIGELIKNKLLPIGNELNHICYLYSTGIIDMNIADRPIDNKLEVKLCRQH